MLQMITHRGVGVTLLNIRKKGFGKKALKYAWKG